MWHFWFQFAIQNVLLALQVALRDKSAAQEIKQSCFDVYYTIQRTYPELALNPGAPPEVPK